MSKTHKIGGMVFQNSEEGKKDSKGWWEGFADKQIKLEGGQTLPSKNETEAIKTVFGDHAYKLNVSSTKSMTGHLLGAAGAIELVAGALAIEHGIVPPTINYHNADPDCDLNYTPNKAIERDLNYVMSNSFGFGGTNASLVLSAVE